MEVSAYLEIAKGLEGVGPDDDDGQKSVNEGVVVIDFGSQYSHLIARRIRELKVYSMIAQSKSTWDSVKHLNPKGVILSGGPASVYEEGAPQIPSWVFEQHLPILGIRPWSINWVAGCLQARSKSSVTPYCIKMILMLARYCLTTFQPNSRSG